MLSQKIKLDGYTGLKYKMSIFTAKTGLQVLEFIGNLKTNYGKNNLSRMVWHELKGSSIQQSKDVLSQLVEKGYLKEMNVGINFAMMVIALTDKGKNVINSKEEIALDFQRFCTAAFKPATDVGVVDKEVIEEYYHIKRELTELQKREEELKDAIKLAMTEKNTPEIHSDWMDLYCKKVERITYPKEKVEKFVPSSILEKIRTVNETIVLTTKLKGAHL